MSGAPSLFARVCLVAVAALVAVGCGGGSSDDGDSRTRPTRAERGGSAAEAFADYYGVSTEQAKAVLSTADASVRPRGDIANWRETAEGQWSTTGVGDVPLIVMVSSYVPPLGGFATPSQWVTETQRQLKDAAVGRLAFQRTEAGRFLGHPRAALVEFESVSPGGRDISHAQYIVLVGPRVYNLIGAAPTEAWRVNRPEIERFVASLDLEHPEPAPREVLPGAAGAEAFPTLSSAASAREVQDVLATWVYEPKGGGKPWFPSKLGCGGLASAGEHYWQCAVDFVTTHGRERDVTVGVWRNKDGSWRAEVEAP
jgi:hypothetical protein